jgi:glycosyltransferase involved in cell wall biosynthesis
MNICHFCSSHFDAPYYSYLGKYFSEKGAQQSFVTINAETPPRWMKEMPQLNYLSLKVGSRFLYPLAIWRLARFLKTNKIDLLQTHLFDAALIGMLAARLAGTQAKIVSRHHMDDGALTGTRFHVMLDKWTNEAADMVIVPSSATCKYMIETEGQAGENIRVVPYGFDFDLLAATNEDRIRIRAEFGFEDDFVIGCVGRFFKNKGHRYLFKAVKGIVEEFPKTKILLLGDGDRNHIELDIAELGIGENIVFAGFRTDVPACMKAMDLLVHPSLSESFGQVVVEAMCVETPVVVTSAGGLPEIVEDGLTGLVVEPKNSIALRDAIKRLLQDSGFRIRLGQAGNKSVREKFSLKQFIDRQWDCYSELLDREKWP